jgi:hypothetical protein
VCSDPVAVHVPAASAEGASNSTPAIAHANTAPNRRKALITTTQTRLTRSVPWNSSARSVDAADADHNRARPSDQGAKTRTGSAPPQRKLAPDEQQQPSPAQNPRVPPFDTPVRIILPRLGEEYFYPELPDITEPDATANPSVDEMWFQLTFVDAAGRSWIGDLLGRLKFPRG